MLSYLTDTHIDPTIANFGVYHRKVIQAILSMGDHVRFFPSMAAWVGFNKTTIDVEHAVRETGKSGYNLHSLLRLGLNVIISILGIINLYLGKGFDPKKVDKFV